MNENSNKCDICGEHECLGHLHLYEETNIEDENNITPTEENGTHIIIKNVTYVDDENKIYHDNDENEKPH